MDVLIIDDHCIVLEGLATFAKRVIHKASFTYAIDVQSAHASLTTKNFDLVISDIHLPGGCIFDQILAAKKRSAAVKVIFLTGMISDANICQAISCGANGIVAKVDGMGELGKCLEHVMSGRWYYSQSVDRKFGNSRPFDFARLKTNSRKITPRELSVLKCLAEGQSTKQVAKNLFISDKTVDRHRCNVMNKLGIHSQVALSHYAIREGLIAL